MIRVAICSECGRVLDPDDVPPPIYPRGTGGYTPIPPCYLHPRAVRYPLQGTPHLLPNWKAPL